MIPFEEVQTVGFVGRSRVTISLAWCIEIFINTYIRNCKRVREITFREGIVYEIAIKSGGIFLISISLRKWI